MNTRSILMTTLCSLMLGMSFTNCAEDIEDQFGPMPEEEAKQRFGYVLNEGLWGANNANISGFVYNVNSNEINALGDLYKKENLVQMGDVANGMVEEDNKIYVVLNSSKYVGKLDLHCKEEARYTIPTGEGEPRCIDVEDDHLYVTHYGGQVSKINVKDMTLAGTFKGGDNLEGVVEKNGKLYVANSYAVDGSNNWIYNDEVFVIDAKTMTLEKTLKVTCNPTKIYEFHDKIYVLSQGNYADVPAVLQSIDPASGVVTRILSTENVSKVTEADNKLIYGVRAAYDANWNPVNTFFICTTKVDEVSETSFLKDAPEALKTSTIYLLEVDEETGFIYVGTSDYVNSGTIYQFDQTGKLLRQFDSGGINPSAMIFLD